MHSAHSAPISGGWIMIKPTLTAPSGTMSSRRLSVVIVANVALRGEFLIRLHEGRRKERVKGDPGSWCLTFRQGGSSLRWLSKEERRRAVIPCRRALTGAARCLVGDRIDELCLIRVEDEDSEQTCRFRVACVRADGVTIAGIFGQAFAGAIRHHRPVIDLAPDCSLQHRCVNEGGAGWVCAGDAPPGPYSTSTPRMLLPGTFGSSGRRRA